VRAVVRIAGRSGAAGERLLCIEAGGERLQSRLLPAASTFVLGLRRAASGVSWGSRRAAAVLGRLNRLGLEVSGLGRRHRQRKAARRASASTLHRAPDDRTRAPLARAARSPLSSPAVPARLANKNTCAASPTSGASRPHHQASATTTCVRQAPHHFIHASATWWDYTPR
jgi:hypothetical protein